MHFTINNVLYNILMRWPIKSKFPHNRHHLPPIKDYYRVMTYKKIIHLRLNGRSILRTNKCVTPKMTIAYLHWHVTVAFYWLQCILKAYVNWLDPKVNTKTRQYLFLLAHYSVLSINQCLCFHCFRICRNKSILNMQKGRNELMSS